MNELITPVLYAFFGILVWEILRKIYSKHFNNVGQTDGAVNIPVEAQKDFDYLYDKTGFVAHKVDANLRFNGYMKTVSNVEAENIDKILFKYSSCGYVFTKRDILLGKVSTFTPKHIRVCMRRSQLKVINGSKIDKPYVCTEYKKQIKSENK